MLGFLNAYRWWFMAAGVVLIFSAGWYVRGNIEDARRGREAVAASKLLVDAVQKQNDIAAAYERTAAVQRKKMMVIQGRLKHEIETNSVYRVCRPTADGVQLLRDARSAATAK